MKKIFSINLISVVMIMNLYFYMFEMYSSYNLYGEIIVENFYIYMLTYILLEIVMLIWSVSILNTNYVRLTELKDIITSFTKHLYILLLPWFILQISIFHMESFTNLIMNPGSSQDSLHLIIAFLMMTKIYKNNWKLEYRVFNSLKIKSSIH